MANDILAKMRGYAYQPFSAATAFRADPLWELGDDVSVDGLGSVLASRTVIFGNAYTEDIEAPNGEEIEHEYPFVSPQQRELKREIARTTASLRVDVDTIKGEVNGLAPQYVPGTRYGINSIVFKDNAYWRCLVTQSSAEWVPAEWAEQQNGAMSSIIAQTLGSIELSASAGNNSSTIRITANGITVDSAVVRFSNIIADSIVANARITAPKIYGGTFFSTTGAGSLSINAGSTLAEMVFTNEDISAEVLKASMESYGSTVFSDLLLQGVDFAMSDGDSVILQNCAINSGGEFRIYTTNGRYWRFTGTGIGYFAADGSYLNSVLLER